MRGDSQADVNFSSRAAITQLQGCWNVLYMSMYWSTAIYTHFLESSVKSLTYKMDNTERVLSPLQVGLCWETISSNPTFSEQVVQGSIQSGFEYLHWWWLHRLTEQCAPMFHHPHLTKQTNMFRWNSIVLTHTHCLLSCHWALLKRIWLPLLHSSLPPQQVLI